MDPERTQIALQRKPKPARFIHGVHFRSAAPDFARPMHKRFFGESLRRFGIASALLHHHHVKISVHINPKLDRSRAAIKLAAGSLV